MPAKLRTWGGRSIQEGLYLPNTDLNAPNSGMLMIRVTRAATQSIAANTLVKIIWDRFDWDHTTDGIGASMWSSGAYVTIPFDGIYHMSSMFTIDFVSGTTGTYNGAQICYLNGSTSVRLGGFLRTSIPDQFAYTQCVEAVAKLAKGTKVFAEAAQKYTSALNLLSANFTVTRLV